VENRPRQKGPPGRQTPRSQNSTLTRHATPEPGVLFSGERDTSESVSENVVSVPPRARPSELQGVPQHRPGAACLAG